MPNATLDKYRSSVQCIPMKRTNHFLPKPMIDKLKALSEKTDISVSELIRQAVDAFLKRLK
jgi:predicted DNA-binding protein